MSSQAEQIGAQLEAFVGRVIGALAANLVVGLRDETPVDTGHAKSNWVASLGGHLPGPFGTKRSVTFSVQDASIARMRSYRLSDGAIDIGNDVHYVPIVDMMPQHKGFILRGLIKGFTATGEEFR